MIKLGITGNIACGKSSIGQYLNEIGFDFIDSDEVVHSILAVKSEATERLIVLCKPYEIRSAAFLKGEENNSNRNERFSHRIRFPSISNDFKMKCHPLAQLDISRRS